MDEQDIIEQAFLHLKDELGEALQWKLPHLRVRDKGYDAVFTLDEQTIYVLARNEIRPAQLAKIQDVKEKYDNLLIAARYITPNAKKLLKEKKLNYIDRSGNTWFRFEPIYIHIDGIDNKPPTEDHKNRAFTPTGIKVVFLFLNNQEFINATYREIVNLSGASLGTIPKVMAGLKEEGFIIRKTKDVWTIKDYAELLNRWHYEYIKELKSRLFVKRYRPIAQEFYHNWRKLELMGGALWGGEPAGDILTNYLKPEIFTLYTNQLQMEIMEKYKWVPDPDGDIKVYKKFWNVDKEQTPDTCAPATIVYADLIETGDPRCIETANMIYERYLQKY